MKRVCIVLIYLAGCSGGSGGTSQATSFADYHQSIVDLGVASAALLPDRGSLEYEGQIVLNLPLRAAAEDYQGSFTFSMDFDGADFAASGEVTGLTNDAGARLTGVLDVDGGVIFENVDPQKDYLFGADLNGTLAKDAVDYDLSAKIQGDFHGNQVEGITGIVYAGRVIDGDNVDVFDGRFAGERVD